MTTHRFTGASIVLTAAVACGTGSTGSAAQTCASYSPCGGNIVGTWIIDAQCGEPASSTTLPLPTCLLSGGTVTTTPTFTSGTVVFTADGTYTTTITTGGTETISLPAACLMGIGAPASCDALATLLRSSAVDAGPTVTCSGMASVSCTCTETVPGQPTTTQGTYTTSGDDLNMMSSSSSGTPTTQTYCVQGGSLGVKSILGSGFVAHM